MSGTYLAIDGLSVAYDGVDVLTNVSLEVAQGEMVALLGSSGCGKTTLLRSIAGFVTPRAGSIRIAGQEILGLPPEKRGTAMMFQSYALWPHMNVAQNIGYGLRMRGESRDRVAARVEELLALLQLPGYGSRPVTQLSGGQRQRVALGRALAINPSVLLLDEPMSNLDHKVRLDLRHELRGLQQRVGITAVYVTHDREEALTLADRIAVIDRGRVVQYGPPEEVFHRPSSPFVAGFMGADNGLDVVVRDDGTLAPASADGAGRPMRAHFRAEDARLAGTGIGDAADALTVTGTVAHAYYVGQGFRYRVRTAGADVWVHATDRVPEGAMAAVVVPRASVMLFPRDPAPAS